MQDQFQDADKGYNSGATRERPFAWELRLASPIAAFGGETYRAVRAALQRKRANISRVIDRTNRVMLHAFHVSNRYHFVRAGHLWYGADNYFLR
jgi:hypothetical protein